MASGKLINLYEASENDLKSLDGIGSAKAKRIIDLRTAKKVFTLTDVADVTQITIEQWNTWSKAGVVTIDKPKEEVVAGLPTPEPSETSQLHLTLLEMNKSLQQLREEVQTLRSEVVLKSEIDESVLPVYKTPIAQANGLHTSEDSSDKTLTLNTETIKTPSKHVDTGKEQKDIIDKLTSVIPSSCYISDPFKGAKPKTSTPLTGNLGATEFQDLSSIPLNPSFGLNGQPLVKKAANSEKQTVVKRLSTHKSESREPRSESTAVGSLTPKQTDRGRTSKKHKRRRSSSSSSSEDTMSKWAEISRSRSRSKSPQLHKLPVFKGTESPNWESFIYQFERIAAHRGWPAHKKTFRLLDCLSDVALEYARRINQNGDYKDLKRQLKQRFSRKEVPVLARRQLPFTKQYENEGVEEFAQRVYFLALDGYESCEGNMLEEIATETFLRGCRDKEAAMKAMDREPATLQKAVKYVRTAIANHRAVYGSRGNTRPVTLAHRQASIPSREGSPANGLSPSRAEPKLSKPNDNKPSLDELINHLTTMVEKLTTTVQQSMGKQTSSSTPAAREQYYDKSRSPMGSPNRGRSPMRSPSRGQRRDSPFRNGQFNKTNTKHPKSDDLNGKGSSL